MTNLTATRRTFLRGTSAALLAAPFASLYTRQAMANGRIEPIASPYGPLAPVADRTTGLPLLQLPEGFTYQSFGWAGDPMDNGQPTPMEHDGMAVVSSRIVNGEAEITLIRNHESKVLPEVGLIGAPAAYDTADVTEDDITGKLSGGTSTIIYRGDAWTSARPSLAGTIDNCAGGATPWGTWLTCEEDLADYTAEGGLTHGYVFEVSPDDSQTTGEPIIAMGRFDHEAVAVDPASGTVYLTEDDRNQAGLYRYIPTDTSGRPGSLAQGGTLYMAKVAGEDRADLLDPAIDETHQIEWVEIADPDLAPQPFTEFPHDEDNLASGPFVQGRDGGALRFSRLEGIWHSTTEDIFYITDTSVGKGEHDGVQGVIGRGEGAVWTYDANTETLTCLWKSDNPLAGNNPDNICVSPRGGVLMCEDGGGVADAFGQGERLLGLTPQGETYIFAKNNIQLDPSTIREAGKSETFIEAEDHRDNEWAGATFDPTGEILFVNIQTPGITFAIKGPWQRGLL
ncbi:MAG: alkaline phosphatase PhoX [Pseudomonadota bacterium]